MYNSNLTGSSEASGGNQEGWKILASQFSTYPCIEHLHFGNKKDLLLPGRNKELTQIANYLSTNRNKYKQFLRQKSRCPSLDIYACFQPFNEAFRALYPFVAYLKDFLKDGDKILNLWDRSGWTAHMLAGWFPRQHIITVWEGDKDILGYRGFDYWMSAERQQNHTILFADFLRPFPIENTSISAVIGMDVLHRFNLDELLSEIQRITIHGAPVIFPHVHLTNNEPEPFFERGCRQLHGKDYQYFFDLIANAAEREGFVVSEPSLFNWNNLTTETHKTLESEPNHTDYNACIAWFSANSKPYLKPWRGHEQANWKEMRLLQNPLLTIDTISYTIQLNEKKFDSAIDELLERHSVYTRRIKQTIGMPIEEDILLVLYWGLQGLQINEIIKRTGIDDIGMQQILQKLWDADLAQAVPVNETGFRLQTLLGHQYYLPEKKESNLLYFWQQSVQFYPNEEWCKIPGEDAVTYAQADELVHLVKKALFAKGLGKGDKLLICAHMHPETLLAFWAAVSLGIIVVPISPKESPARIKEYITFLAPALAITDPYLYKTLKEGGCNSTIMTDQLDDAFYDLRFSFQNWLESAMEVNAVSCNAPEHDDIAIILSTTGSTGSPKSIPVTHEQLIRSGRMMTETYHWKKTDKYYALGGMETMSGSRHATVSIAEVGASCVIVDKNADIYGHVETIIQEKISIVTANPVFFRQLLLAGKGRLPFLKKSLRLSLSTGNQLSPNLKKAWKETTGIPLYNYYGLTETTGICIAEPPGFASEEKNSIGLPVDCLVKILDESGDEVQKGLQGELCVYGAGVFNGYYKNDDATTNSLVNGWFHTKDLAIQNEDGSLSLCGRFSDIVKLPSGERVEIAAIEEVMESVFQLNDWAVCSLKEEEKESIAIFIVPDVTANLEKLLKTIKEVIGNAIGSYAVPSLIEPVTHIPRGNHNKVLHKKLTDSYFQSIKNNL